MEALPSRISTPCCPCGSRSSRTTIPKTNITLALDAYPGLSQWGRLRTEFNGSVKREIVHDFTLGFTIYDSYDNRPPTAEARKNDVGLSLTIGWTF